jgi:hypothetical protein
MPSSFLSTGLQSRSGRSTVAGPLVNWSVRLTTRGVNPGSTGVL